ncbi:MAG: zinc ribbon domain-containing protein [Promethearchaeota archaeon]
MSNQSLELRWNNFGRYILAVAILWLFIFIPYVAFGVIVLQFIFINLAINEIKIIKSQLNNPNLEVFCSKAIAGNIIKLIGLIVINVGGAMIAGSIMLRRFFHIFPRMLIFIPPLVVIIVGFVIMIIASSIEMQAWENLKNFLQQNKESFPTKIAQNVVEGADNLKSGTFLWALGFLFIPIIIGWLFHVAGYFKLASFNKLVPKKEIEIIPTPEYKSTSSHVLQTATTPAYQSTTVPVYQTIVAHTNRPDLENIQGERNDFNFCPICGAKLDRAAKFCGECGSHLRD